MLQLILADQLSCPAALRLWHGAAPDADAMEALSDEIALQHGAGGRTPLSHVFRLDAGIPVQRFLRVHFYGHLLASNSGEMLSQ